MAALPPPEVIKSISDTLIQSRIYATAAYAVFIWDVVCTFGTERKYIWPGQWTLMKVLYLVNRYWTLCAMAVVIALFNVNISIEKCSKIVNFEAYSLAAVLCITSSIMLLRAHALWDQRRWVGALCVLVVATEVTVLFYLASFGEAAPLNPLGITGCVWSNANGKDWFYMFFVLPLIIDILVFVATAAKIFLLWTNTGRTPLLTLLLRDGLVFLAAVLVVNLLNTVAFIKGTPANNPAFHSPFSEVWTSMMCSRIVLSLRKNAYKSSPVSAANPFSGGKHSGGNNAALGQQTTGFSGLQTAPSFQLRHLGPTETVDDLEKHAGGPMHGGGGDHALTYNYAGSDAEPQYASGIHVSVEKRVVNEA